MVIPDDRTTAPKLLVVIDHHEARVYRTRVQGTIPVRIVSYDPHGYGRDKHSALEWAESKRLSGRKGFYEAIAKTLLGAEQVLLFGSGTGRSSAMEKLLADLKDHHPVVAKKVIGWVIVDAHQTTGGQLLAKARDFYAEFNRKSSGITDGWQRRTL